MCLTLSNASAVIDHHPSLRPTGRGYTRTFHSAYLLSPGDLWRPVPNQDPHTVTELHRTRDRRYGPDWITIVDQYAKPCSYGSDDLLPTAIPDPSNYRQRCTCKENAR